jgi:ribosomal protein S12 methylthiotransferase accessory factor
MNESRKPVIGLLGGGLIAHYVQRRLANACQVLPYNEVSGPEMACALLVYCSDVWAPGTLRDINRRCLQAEVALLPIYTQFAEGMIGPCVIPRQAGCTSCAELRKSGAISFTADRELLRASLSQVHSPVTYQPWLSSFGLETLALLAAREVTTYLHDPAQLQTACALLTVSLSTLQCQRHSLLPSPACPDCGQQPADRAELAEIVLQARPKADAATYRIREPLAGRARILATYVDQCTGLVSSLLTQQTRFLPTTSTQLSTGGETTTGTGCTLSPDHSQLVSVLEVVERYAGLRPRGKRTAVRASYHQLLRDGQPTLDPGTLGLPALEQYEQQHDAHTCRRLRPYHPDLVCHWVWGYSFQRRSPVLVPEHCAYYGLPANDENPVFVSEISNGCALGNCLEEAILHGMLEVVERDAFLLMWYARLQVPRLDPHSLTDPTARLLLEHLEYHSGYTIHIFHLALDHAVPCLCLLGVDEQMREGKPKAIVAAGAHPRPEQALVKALREFAMFLAFPRVLDQQSRARAQEMLADAHLVRQMEHHPLVYYLPEAFERLHFLYHTPRCQTFQEAFPEFYQGTGAPERLDLRDDLEALIAYYLKRETDSIVVDQTAPEHRSCGLSCVKVLMPGMLPMTFGQQNRRITGFQRLRQLPWTLGYQDHPLTVGEINPYPHPFF